MVNDNLKKLSKLGGREKTKLVLDLDLAEQQDKEIYNFLLSEIEHSQDRRSIGTLVYALRYYPPEPLFERAIDWILYENFEAAHEAFEIIDSISELNGDIVKNAYIKISNAVSDDLEKWRLELLKEVLELFN